jgi:hypothetical protein
MLLPNASDRQSYLVNFADVDAFVKEKYGADSREYHLFSSTTD